MCIFTGNINQVSATRIFGRNIRDRQVIIYDMFLSSDNELAMVLPIPVAIGSDNSTVSFVDLSQYQNLFDDLDDLFPASRFAIAAAANQPADDTLEVVNVGVFEASLVPKAKDFARLDNRYRLPEAFFSVLPIYQDYGFVVFKLRPGESRVHPMAFSFSTRDNGRLFFPTVHMHDSEVHTQAQFNHTLYAQGDIKTFPGLRASLKKAHSNELTAIAHKSLGLVSAMGEVFKVDIWGTQENKDIWFDLNKF